MEAYQQRVTEAAMKELTKQITDDWTVGRWITIHGLSKNPELNGQIGEIVSNEARSSKERVAVRVYENSNGWRKLHNAVSIKIENCTPFPRSESDTIHAVRIMANGDYRSRRWNFIDVWIPKLFVEQVLEPTAQSSPVLQMCSYPVKIAKVEPYTKLVERVDYDNQMATYLMVDSVSGFAPSNWQSYVGSVVIYRPGGKPLSTDVVSVLHEYMSDLLDQFGDGRPVSRKFFTREYLADFFDDYLKSFKPGNFYFGNPTLS